MTDDQDIKITFKNSVKLYSVNAKDLVECFLNGYSNFNQIYFTITHIMNEFVLKNLNKNNCSSLFLFQKKFKELENNIWKIDDLKNLISKQSYFGKLCFKQKSIVGFCLGNQVFDIFEIYSIFVHPLYRRNGIAKKILDECIIFCQEKRLKKLFWR